MSQANYAVPTSTRTFRVIEGNTERVERFEHFEWTRLTPGEQDGEVRMVRFYQINGVPQGWEIAWGWQDNGKLERNSHRSSWVISVEEVDALMSCLTEAR